MQGPHDALVQIAVASIATMSVALGGSAPDLKGASAKEIVAKHASTSEAFKKAFPVGGVASVEPEDKKKPVPNNVTPFNAARLAAVRAPTEGGK